MCKDNITFKRRPYEIITFVKNVGDPDPGKIEIGDEVVLYQNINDKSSEIIAKIIDIDPENHITGIITNKPYGCELEKGAKIKFEEINVFRFANFKKRL